MTIYFIDKDEFMLQRCKELFQKYHFTDVIFGQNWEELTPMAKDFVVYDSTDQEAWGHDFSEQVYYLTYGCEDDEAPDFDKKDPEELVATLVSLYLYTAPQVCLAS